MKDVKLNSDDLSELRILLQVSICRIDDKLKEIPEEAIKLYLNQKEKYSRLLEKLYKC